MKIFAKMIVSALAITFLVTSCSKVEEAGNTDFISDAGMIHNQLLDHYYDSRSNLSPGTEELISEVIELSSDYLLSNGYDRKHVLEAKSMLKDRYRASNLKSVTNTDLSIDVDELSIQLKELDVYSDPFISEVEKIVSMVDEEVDMQEVLSYVNSDFTSVVYESETDRMGQVLFQNIFNGSYGYWTDEDNSNLKGVTKLDDRSWVIINDGIGGILGLVFGPAGSIITATAFSVGTNEELTR